MKISWLRKDWLIAPILFLSLLGTTSLMHDQVYAEEASTAESAQMIVSETVESQNSVPETSNPEVAETTSVAEPAAEQEQSSSVDDSSETTSSSEETAVIDKESTEITSESSTEQTNSSEAAAETSVESGTNETKKETEQNTTEPTQNAAAVKTPPQESTAAAKSQTEAVATMAQTKAAVSPPIAIYRVYNPNSGEHLHTQNSYEKDFLVRLGWRYEGISMRVGLTGRDLFRIYNPNSGEHFFTLDAKERDNLRKNGWRYEGIAWYTPWAGMPMYRVYNPNTRGAGAHHYTMLLSERNYLIKVGWRNEGISWYTLGGAQPIAPVQRTLAVPYVSQYTPVFSPWGCAGASLTMLLRYKGKTVDLKYVQDHLPMYPNDQGGQKGNVYTGAGFGWVITPGSLANYAKKWYSNVSNITGTSTQSIVDRIIGGNPVLYYGYSSYQTNTFRNHCKVIVGYKDNQFLVHDPLYYSSSAKAGAGGPNKTYDRGAIAWVSITDFNKEWDGRALGIS